ncbi:MAG TPA: PEP-utilizing enzyme [Dehalococcoidia bacterium]|nr:PEP-utilizing enzyme [Dehalococcoidia bacterium]
MSRTVPIMCVGWPPPFAVAEAVVTDAGGVLSHAAIAAREYALPAMVGTGIGTEKIVDGSRITVDGGQGLVRLQP